ncbi:Rapamycin-insensitive companion of mTOR, N-term-domain-containing protein [Calycina marina]|uniref:Rapamycin-insensitive companion of mTOR, N-term-domain-containing protein n=1 Tax=Calycina marina TaxID=1763456 RepID=A0A9P7YZX7_9HELO|nr:Rapamycin-insensitive companion of mTOR, N-term-domain-containing protein [Calycina marina]
MNSSSATPTQKSLYTQPSLPYTNSAIRTSLDRDGLQPGTANGGRSMSNLGASFVPRGPSQAPSPAPGSFTSTIRGQFQMPRNNSSQDAGNTMRKSLDDPDNTYGTGQLLTGLRDQLTREMKIKEGSENMLEALNNKKAKQTKEQRYKVEAELNISNQKIKNLRNQITELQKPKVPATPTRNRMEGLFHSNGLRSPQSASRSITGSDYEEPAESPTYALAEVLQALEVEGLTPDYYVQHANNFVELFKRHPTLKYDLVWSVFGLRMQVMLLSESREVVAAGYRMTRYAISDITSLQKIRALNTDYLVVLSLIKERKADVEREQALKFVRAFLEVKGGISEVSRSVVRTIAAVAEHAEDRLRSICIETLAELMIRNPALVLSAGGLRPLADALGEGTYEACESLTAAFLFLLDAPQRREYLRSGNELEVLFVAFTDSLFAKESVLKQNAKAISYAMKSWPGLMTLSMYNFRAIRSLVSCLMLPNAIIRETVIELFYNLLRIKSPGWAISFLAGRRLTTYGRVATLKTNQPKTQQSDDESEDRSFVDHYTSLLLAVLISSGLMSGLLQVTRETDNPMLKRKTTLLIGEVLKLASILLPSTWSSELQLLPDLFIDASQFKEQKHFGATGTVYQISSVSRTLYRSTPTNANALSNLENSSLDDQPKPHMNLTLDETTFRALLVETQVLSSTNASKWKWDIILKIIEGPLLNGKRLDEAIKASKFVKRIMSFYRPFKYKFPQARKTRGNEKFVKVGCALMHTLLQTPEGVRYLADNKLLRQIAECLAQCDPTSGLTAQDPMFSRERLTETMCSGYFPMIGVLSGDSRGLQMLDRWRMINMMYHIIDLKQQPDLIKLLLQNFDYSLAGHPRVLLSKALTAGSKEIRIFATTVLRKYSSRARLNGSANQGVGDSKWAIQLLVTQLYDPEVEVCATAIKILEEACNRKSYLEYIVECRPALDHLGEIGAPLLLRFLSTSIGYHYLDGLDYISNEMDDWFLGRNDSYVGVIEASLARSFGEIAEETTHRLSIDEETFEMEGDVDAQVPPHFYRELTRTKEGCKLLRDKGHFEEFANTIRDYGMLSNDPEPMLKVKGALWAVGNVGSMELGAPFLEVSDVVENIVKIAESHEVMSLRGTAFFVLGLISRSIHGLEILSEHGWESNTTTLGVSLGLCIPKSLGNFFSYQPWQHVTVTKSQMGLPEEETTVGARIDDDPTNARILQLIMELGNTVLKNKAMTELMHLKTRKSPGFSQAGLFKKVLLLLECHQFRLNMRRFAIDLFEKTIMRQLVLDEESSDEDPGSDDDDSSEGRTERQRSIGDTSGNA